MNQKAFLPDSVEKAAEWLAGREILRRATGHVKASFNVDDVKSFIHDPKTLEALKWGLIGAGGLGTAGLAAEAMGSRKKKQPLRSFLTTAILGGLGGVGANLAYRNWPQLTGGLSKAEADLRTEAIDKSPFQKVPRFGEETQKDLESLGYGPGFWHTGVGAATGISTVEFARRALRENKLQAFREGMAKGLQQPFRFEDIATKDILAANRLWPLGPKARSTEVAPLLTPPGYYGPPRPVTTYGEIRDITAAGRRGAAGVGTPWKGILGWGALANLLPQAGIGAYRFATSVAEKQEAERAALQKIK